MSLKDTKVQIIIFLILVLGGGIYFWYTSMYQPILTRVEEKSTELQAIKVRLETAKRQAARRVSLEQEYEALQEQWRVVETLLPKERDMADFIQQLHRIKGKVDASIERVHPLSAKPMGFYTENPYEIEMQTTYHGLGRFLSLVANLPIIVDVHVLDMVSLPQPEGEEEKERVMVRPSISARLLLTSYSLVEEEINTQKESTQ
jgi:type IV pilus assembly protein PilO